MSEQNKSDSSESASTSETVDRSMGSAAGAVSAAATAREVLARAEVAAGQQRAVRVPHLPGAVASVEGRRAARRALLALVLSSSAVSSAVAVAEQRGARAKPRAVVIGVAV